jgi:hypothetical protein
VPVAQYPEFRSGCRIIRRSLSTVVTHLAYRILSKSHITIQIIF